MLLAIDVGNSNTKLALVGTERWTPVETWRTSTDPQRMPDEWHALLASLVTAAGRRLDAISAVAIASVSPIVTRWLDALCRNRLGIEPVVLKSDQDLGIPIRTEAPWETGIDRVLNGLAAFRRVGGAVVVVDCGTATKFDAVGADGAFLGGAIAPGMGLMLDGLANRAARLFAVELLPPARSLGTNTVASLQSGVVLGYLSLCEGMIRRITSETGADRVIATGGAGAIVAEHLPIVSGYEPLLTTEGIVAAYRRISAASLAAVGGEK